MDQRKMECGVSQQSLTYTANNWETREMQLQIEQTILAFIYKSFVWLNLS